MSVFFSSDHHFSHSNIIAFCDRPFDDVEEMNWNLVEKWNETVKPQDIVYYLGDFAMGRLPASLEIGKQLNGIKILIPGNHDACFQGNRHQKLWAKHYIETAGFSAILPSASIVLGPYTADLCHFPYTGDSRDLRGKPDRWSIYRPNPHPTKVLLHGHVHQNWLYSNRGINVGVDVWDLCPVSLDILVETFHKHLSSE